MSEFGLCPDCSLPYAQRVALYSPTGPQGRIVQCLNRGHGNVPGAHVAYALERAAELCIRQIVREEIALYEQTKEETDHIGRDRDTLPAPSPESWSGADVVPRGSSRPPMPPTADVWCGHCGMLACVCSHVTFDNNEGGLEK